MISTVLRVSSGACVAALLATVPLGAQTPERWSLLLARGKDTVAIERARLTPTGASGDMAERISGSRVSWQYAREDDRASFRLVVRGGQDAANAPPKQRVDLTFTGDSVVAIVTNGAAAPVTRRVAAIEQLRDQRGIGRGEEPDRPMIAFGCRRHRPRMAVLAADEADHHRPVGVQRLPEFRLEIRCCRHACAPVIAKPSNARRGDQVATRLPAA